VDEPADARVPGTGASRSILVKLPAALRSEAIHLRFLQRGEQIDVRVASHSESAVRELRENLPQLLTRLQQAGFSADSFGAGADRIPALERADNSAEADRRSSFTGEQDQHQQQRHEDDRDSPGQNRKSGGEDLERMAMARRGVPRDLFRQLFSSAPAGNTAASARPLGADSAELTPQHDERRHR